MSLNIGVVGGGSFGRGIATAALRKGAKVILWTRRKNPTDVPGATITADVSQLQTCTLIVIAVPSTYIPKVAPVIGAHLDGRHLLVHVSRGLIGEKLETISRHLARHTPCRRVGCLAGPLNPDILSEGRPGGAIVGTGYPEIGETLKEALGGPNLRLYTTADTVGTEVASASAGLLAFGAGFCLETQVSPGAMAVMMNRGIVEASRIGMKLGGREETFHGLAGAGDLLAAVGGDNRAEVQLGRSLAQGMSMDAAGQAIGAHFEGLAIARQISNFAARVGVKAPIADTIAEVLDGKISPREGFHALMER